MKRTRSRKVFKIQSHGNQLKKVFLQWSLETKRSQEASETQNLRLKRKSFSHWKSVKFFNELSRHFQQRLERKRLNWIFKSWILDTQLVKIIKFKTMSTQKTIYFYWKTQWTLRQSRMEASSRRLLKKGKELTIQFFSQWSNSYRTRLVARQKSLIGFQVRTGG